MGFQCVDWKVLVVDIISKTMLFLTTQNFFQIYFLFYFFGFFFTKDWILVVGFDKNVDKSTKKS